MSQEAVAAKEGTFDEPGREGLLACTLEDVLNEISAPERSLTSGSAAALAVAFAAALVCGLARATTSTGDPEASGKCVQAESLRIRAVELAEKNRDRYAAARLALSQRHLDPGFMDQRIGAAMVDTIETLEALAGAGADVAELAAGLVETVAPELLPDAASAAELAETGTKLAFLLVEANLISSNSIEAVERVRGESRAAGKARARAYAFLMK